MTCLLLNMEPDLSDPRVMVATDKMAAIHQLNALPNRVGWVVAGAEDLSGPADFAPEFLGRVTLTAPALVRVHNTFAPSAVSRFESRPVAARRTARLLLDKFGINNEEEVVMSEVHTEVHQAAVVHQEFTLAPGVRITLLPEASKGIPEEHGVVVEVADDMVTVEVDPLYRVNEQDDGRRDVEARECGPDPVGEMRMKADSESVKNKKQIKEEMKAQKAAEREAARAAKASAKAARTKEPKAARQVQVGKFGEDGVITRVSEENPKRPGSLAHGYWETVKTGMTVKQAVEAGVPLGDLKWNFGRGFIQIA